jgi:hypothetical protein
MASRATLRAFVALALIAVVMILVGAGCGEKKGSTQTADFVGKWRAEVGPQEEMLLDLKGNGQGSNMLNLYPHDQGCYWSVVSNELVITPMDGAQATRYQFKFEGKDKLTLTHEGQAKALVRVK